MISENRDSVHQHAAGCELRHQARAKNISEFIATYRAALARQGSISKTWRLRAGKRVGPYFLLVVRDETGRRRSVYLGVEGPLVDAARAELAELQNPRREHRVFTRTKYQLRREHRLVRRELDQQLALVGLRRKGSEIRGWRLRPFLLAMGDRNEHQQAAALETFSEVARKADRPSNIAWLDSVDSRLSTRSSPFFRSDGEKIPPRSVAASSPFDDRRLRLRESRCLAPRSAGAIFSCRPKPLPLSPRARAPCLE
jgi:hypothetical protein